MILMQGKGVSKGVVKGKLYFYERPNTNIECVQVADVEAEKARLAAAQEKSIAQLEVLADAQVAVENITRMATNQGYQVSVAADGDEFKLTLSK